MRLYILAAVCSVDYYIRITPSPIWPGCVSTLVELRIGARYEKGFRYIGKQFGRGPKMLPLDRVLKPLKPWTGLLDRARLVEL